MKTDQVKKSTEFGIGFEGGHISFGNEGAEMLSAPRLGATHHVWVLAAVRAGALFWVMMLIKILVFMGFLTTETRLPPAFSRYPGRLGFV